MTYDELRAFFVLLAVAANDTTRHASAQAIYAFSKFPDQKALLVKDIDGRIDTAVEEVLRWSSPRRPRPSWRHLVRDRPDWCVGDRGEGGADRELGCARVYFDATDNGRQRQGGFQHGEVVADAGAWAAAEG
jgi:hypothetical protein